MTRRRSTRRNGPPRIVEERRSGGWTGSKAPLNWRNQDESHDTALGWVLLTGLAADDAKLTDEQATRLLNEHLDITAKDVSVKKKYAGVFLKLLPASKVTRFFQLENKPDAIVNFELAATTVQVDVGGGIVGVPMSRVERIVKARCPLDDYAVRAAKLTANDTAGWLKLARVGFEERASRERPRRLRNGPGRFPNSEWPFTRGAANVGP